MSFDKYTSSFSQQLLSAGIQDPTAAIKNLDLIQDTIGIEPFTRLIPSILSALAKAADPDMALNHFERFAGALRDVPAFVSLCEKRQDILNSLITLFGASRFLSSYLVGLADTCLQFFEDPAFFSNTLDKKKIADQLATLMQPHPDEKSFFAILRTFRKQAMLRIALRDLLGKADLRETVEELSDLAEVCLQTAYEYFDAQLTKRYGSPLIQHPDGTVSEAGFAIIAMGKLGGRELNFSSDVDLMYVYSKDGETQGGRVSDGALVNRITNHQYFIKLAEKISAALHQVTEDGFVFRVDLRLRPEGQRGPLTQSLGGYETYYESWGQTWERSALIKARPVAGSESVGNEFLGRIAPFVYRKYLDYAAITEIRDMKQKINEEVIQKGRTYRDVKLGYGGIREIEFVIQALQLMYAGRDRGLREKNALKALHMLSLKGLITYQEHADLSKAYIFLRTVEHRLQMLDDLQTHTLPLDEQELRALARRTGYLDAHKETECLLRDYTEHTHKVRGMYDDLFAFTGEETKPDSAFKNFQMLFHEEASEQEVTAFLSQLGFCDPGKAYRNLILLREGPAFVHQTPRSRKLFFEIFPPLFAEIIASPDPDMAFNHLESFFSSRGSWEMLQVFMKLDRATIKMLIAVFSNSEYLSRLIISQPMLLQNVVGSSDFLQYGGDASFHFRLHSELEKKHDLPAKLDTLRRFKHQEEIRIGIADLLLNPPMSMVSRALSKLAEASLDEAFKLAAFEIGKRYGSSHSPNGFAIIGIGKLGGRELGYGSDLDILFVYEESAAPAHRGELSAFEYFSKIAEKTISYLSTMTQEGFVFRIDTRLRPAGSKGPLVQNMSAFKEYYVAQAETWERQALLRSRHVAGDRNIGRLFISSMQDVVYREYDPALLAYDILSMRRRMQEEVGKEGPSSYNIKQGAGGLVDIEFLVQYLQLLFGKDHFAIRIPGTSTVLRALKKERLLTNAEYVTLLHAYQFMRRLESRMRIVSNQATNMLSRDPAKLVSLARRMGYENDGTKAGRKLLSDYEQISLQVRTLFERKLHQT
ncbi:MAG: bifunctional [glutamate--ammonia ligase]-adenylyl-L-tyrosine phosphorylase/[glutamate--ammonia-ligase] adenylyltransferase [Nitrospirota bacterium]